MSESLKSIVEGRMATYQTQDECLGLDAELRPNKLALSPFCQPLKKWF